MCRYPNCGGWLHCFKECVRPIWSSFASPTCKAQTADKVECNSTLVAAANSDATGCWAEQHNLQLAIDAGRTFQLIVAETRSKCLVKMTLRCIVLKMRPAYFTQNTPKYKHGTVTHENSTEKSDLCKHENTARRFCSNKEKETSFAPAYIWNYASKLCKCFLLWAELRFSFSLQLWLSTLQHLSHTW